MAMASTGKWLIVLLSIAAVAAKEKERPKFTPGPASSYEAYQTVSGVTLGAQAMRSDAETEPAFGKLNPNHYGILPVLVVIENGSNGAVEMSRIRVEIVTPDRRRADATPAGDLKYLSGPTQPQVYTGPSPTSVPHISRKKNPLADWTIEGRAFSARMLPPHESASGFFYFRAPYQAGCTLYVSGLREAATGKELFYFELPLP
jgi:hypothetical protein